ncbi:hypothetical protein ACHAWF_015069, partial [Thalassiosira exigua]
SGGRSRDLSTSFGNRTARCPGLGRGWGRVTTRKGPAAWRVAAGSAGSSKCWRRRGEEEQGDVRRLGRGPPVVPRPVGDSSAGWLSSSHGACFSLSGTLQLRLSCPPLCGRINPISNNLGQELRPQTLEDYRMPLTVDTLVPQL